MKRTYPYDAWTLQPSFKPVLVTIKDLYHSWGTEDDWEVSVKGKFIHIANLFPTKEAAIEAGWERVHKEEAKLGRMLDRINKKRAALAKAAESA